MRIISLLASATEMIYELGCLDQLVGRSHECDFPPQVRSLPVVSKVQIDIDTSSAKIDEQIKQLARASSITENAALKALSIYSIDVEQLQALRPDVIFTQTQCEVCAVSERDVMQAVQQLTGLQPRVVSLAPHQLSDVWQDVLRVGQALEVPERARQLVNGYKKRMDQLHSITSSFAYRPRVAVLEWLDPLMGAGNWTPELVACAGGANIFGEVGLHSPWLTWEELLQANPAVLVLSPCGFTIERTLMDLPLLQQHTLWSSLQAVQTGQVYAIDGNQYLNRSGPRLVESAELLGRVVWGENIGVEVDAQGWKHIT
ncbi:MAG TPA: cobalamin-binding protein [Ktedonobacter sp.]|jgi:iron complex transport system substrate-binding protein|nr:cobalamin-binding protein [Ktedonobacter sp.]HAH00542.1 cobalamin-binding protein [Ktedonobacter sp.]HAT46093.1 cobalamin-binding protein [Ktedonobacter sp.]HBE24593.1 cobalamin-binding protein [Ktedonobacter sp.]HCF85767.1 cobalamin-binding protein [Ktedonobacter sp.]